MQRMDRGHALMVSLIDRRAGESANDRAANTGRTVEEAVRRNMMRVVDVMERCGVVMGRVQAEEMGFDARALEVD